MKKESSPMKVAIPAAVLSLIGPVAAFAAEGTGRVSILYLIINNIYFNINIKHKMYLYLTNKNIGSRY